MIITEIVIAAIISWWDVGYSDGAVAVTMIMMMMMMMVMMMMMMVQIRDRSHCSRRFSRSDAA